MISVIKISTTESSDTSCTGALRLYTSDSYLAIKTTDENTILLSMSQQLLNKRPQEDIVKAIYTINGVSPDIQTGKFFLLGSLCTSIKDSTDISDSLMPAIDNSFYIYDGCFPCDSCKSLAQLQQDIQNCQIWINGLKDCNLYNEPAASRLWEEMLNKKTTQGTSCNLDSAIIENRQRDFGQAIKLLYQYKAVVAMWNYLVRNKAGVTQVIRAPEDYGGFIIQSKRNIDSCGRDSAGNPTFRVKVTLQSGQCPSYLQEGGTGMGFYINKVTQNSYIEYGRDTGMTSEQDSNNINMQILYVRATNQDTIEIQILFTFYPTRVAASVFSASVKIIPVIFKLQAGAPISPSRISLDSWIQLRSSATTIKAALQTGRNIWYVQSAWTIPQGSNSGERTLPQDYYYYTAYSKYPGEQSDSGSESEAEV